MYQTRDFNFVAFAMTFAQPKVDIAKIVPFPSPSARHSGKGVHYEFSLVGEGGEDISEALAQLALDYTNGRTTVEPTAFLAKRGILRGLIIDQDERNRSGRKQLKRGERHV